MDWFLYDNGTRNERGKDTSDDDTENISENYIF